MLGRNESTERSHLCYRNSRGRLFRRMSSRVRRAVLSQWPQLAECWGTAGFRIANCPHYKRLIVCPETGTIVSSKPPAAPSPPRHHSSTPVHHGSRNSTTNHGGGHATSSSTQLSMGAIVLIPILFLGLMGSVVFAAMRSNTENSTSHQAKYSSLDYLEKGKVDDVEEREDSLELAVIHTSVNDPENHETIT